MLCDIEYYYIADCCIHVHACYYTLQMKNNNVRIVYVGLLVIINACDMTLYHLSCFTLVNDFCLGSLAHGKHLVQALPPLFAFQCLTGKADKNNKQTNTCESIPMW